MDLKFFLLLFQNPLCSIVVPSYRKLSGRYVMPVIAVLLQIHILP